MLFVPQHITACCKRCTAEEKVPAKMKKKKKGQDGNKQSMNYEVCLLTTFLFFFFFLNQQPLKLHNYRVWVYFVDECEFGLFKILEKP